MITIELDAELYNSMKQALIVAIQVRGAQKAFFANRKSPTLLIEAKRLETALDVRLAELERMGLR